MVRTTITPENQDISIHIPEDYIGRQIEVLLYAIDEVSTEASTKKKKTSDFAGKMNLTEEQYQDFQNHAKNIRKEWDRDF